MALERDLRLTALINGQYRLWHDTQKINIPRGMSTTRPLAPENIHTKIHVDGVINKSYFNNPRMYFLNTEVNTKYFDWLYLQTWRPGEEIPQEPDIDWHDDLGLQAVKIRFSLTFSVAADTAITGRSSGICWLDYSNPKNWVSQVMEFDDYNLQHLRGDFIIVTNPTEYQRTIGQDFATGKFLQETNLPLSIIINDVSIINGNSKMDVILKNPTFAVTLTSFDFSIIGGE